MNWPRPKTYSEYPLYMLGYWSVLVALSPILLYLLVIRDSMTPDGLFVIRKECAAYEPIVVDSRGPTGGDCVGEENERYVPVGVELREGIQRSAWVSASVVIVVAGFSLWEKRKRDIAEAEERERKRREQEYFASKEPLVIKCEKCRKKNKVPFGSRLANCAKCGEELDLGLSFFEKHG